MSWLRVDDGFTKHPKFEGWSAAAKWAWLEVMEYCARYRTEGRIPDDLALLPRAVTPSLLARAEKAAWCVRLDDGALWINDWEKYNPADPTKAERQARWRKRKEAGVDGDVDDTARLPSNGRVDDEVTGESSTSRAGPRARSRPVPIDPPIPPPSGGNKTSTSPRAEGTNPRAQAAYQEAAEQAERLMLHGELLERANDLTDHWTSGGSDAFAEELDSLELTYGSKLTAIEREKLWDQLLQRERA